MAYPRPRASMDGCWGSADFAPARKTKAIKLQLLTFWQKSVEAVYMAAMGPAMEALSARQRAFVVALVVTGGNNTRAALSAGYGQNRVETAEQAGWRLSTNPKVQEAIREEAQKRLNAGAIMAASVLHEIASDPLHKDRFKAADRLLERAGLMVATRHEVNVTDNRTTAQLEAFIRQKALELKMDPEKLLGRRAALVPPKEEVVDAEFEDVTGSTEGLEDLL